MKLSDRLYQDYVAAMKAQDKPRVEFLSYVRAQVKYAELSAKAPLAEEEVLAVLRKQKKNVQETLESVAQAGDAERSRKAQGELAIINEYLPAPLADSELRALIDAEIAALAATSAKDMGRVMKAVMANVGAAAEAGRVSEIVKGRLAPPGESRS